jgi:hypothetical protein
MVIRLFESAVESGEPAGGLEMADSDLYNGDTWLQ